MESVGMQSKQVVPHATTWSSVKLVLGEADRRLSSFHHVYHQEAMTT